MFHSLSTYIHGPLHKFGNANIFKIGYCGEDENVLQSIYAYFFHNPKITKEFVTLNNTVKTKV
jgi:hypothetical protein